MEKTTTEKASKMTGRLSHPPTVTCRMPYPSDEFISFDCADVRSFGKISVYGSQGCTRYMVRLVDGREAFIRACDQSKDVERWLRKVAKQIVMHGASREIGVEIRWVEVVS